MNQDSLSPNRLFFVKFVFFILFVILLVVLYWLFFFDLSTSTDDASVSGNIVPVMSSQPGTVIAIHTEDTQHVQQGQLLVSLDPVSFQLKFDEAKENLAIAVSHVRDKWQEQKKIQAGIQESLLDKQPEIENAKISLRQAYINLERCSIKAPVSGYIAKRTVQLGEWITPTKILMHIIPLDQIWVEANFKETDLQNIRVGQPAKITTDLYGPNVIFHGKVSGIQASTGSVFSLIPPQNATGNWIKIVQRVSIFISLDSDEIKKYPLLLGLSTTVSIDTSKVEGPLLVPPVSSKPIYTTPIYQIDMQKVETIIEDIVQKNLFQ